MATVIPSQKSGRRPHRPGRRGPQWPISSRSRLITVWGVLMLSMLGISVKLAQLQLVKGPQLKAYAQTQQQIQRVPRAARRPIIDRLGNALAFDRVVYTLYVHPLLFKQSKEAVAQALSPLLEKPATDLLNQFSRQETGIKLATEIPEALAKHLKALRLDGLELLPDQKRFYPQQALMSQIVGYINLDGDAQAGLEYSLQDQLRYARGKNQSLSPVSAATQDDLRLQLTLDSRLQRVAQRNLEATVAQFGAKRGTVIVMDSRDGAILALGVTPGYDPNRFYEAQVEQFKNWAVSDVYEPGSTFKPINVAIALEEGTIGPNDYLNDEGRIERNGWPIKNADYAAVGGRGSVSLTDILRYSSNVGMVHLMETLKRPTYYAWLQRLGLGQITGIELPAESAGQLKPEEQFVSGAIEPATTAFGQGFSLTPIQLVQLQAALANGGKLVTPHVVSGLVDAQGQIAWQPDRPAAKQLFSQETTRQVLKMMEAVVEDGTGEPAKIPGYQIGGKTGTAQKATAAGRYGNGRITSFVGILPIDNPRYVVLAVIDEPKGDNAYGSTVAAPLVKSVIEALVVMAGIPPQSPPAAPAAVDE